MDLALFARVLWRFWYVMFVGILIAGALAFLSVVRVHTHGSDRFTYRQQQEWASYSTLYLTQKGFIAGEVNPTVGAQASDPDRFSGLAVTLANVVTSDRVRAIMSDSGPISGTVQAAALTAPNDPTDVLPEISIAGISTTESASLAVTRRATAAFLAYYRGQQRAHGISGNNRVLIQVLNRPGSSKLLQDRSQTLPLVVFSTVLIAAIALCFVLENLRPRVRAVDDRHDGRVDRESSARPADRRPA
jgi:hypothetical protein